MENFISNSLCERAELYYYDFLSDRNDTSIPAEVIGHIETCQNCRRQIDNLKSALAAAESNARPEDKNIRSVVNDLLISHFSCMDKKITCRDVRAFMPQLSDENLEIRIPTPITVHPDHCQKCCEDIEMIRGLKGKKLQQAMKKINKQPESGVITIYHIDPSAKAKISLRSDDIYAGYPVKVEVIESEVKKTFKISVPIIDFTETLKRKVTSVNVRSLLKGGIVAAAVLLIAFILLLNIPSAKAVTIKQVYKAIENAGNVYIKYFAPSQTEPAQEKWISKSLNIYTIKTGSEIVLWDMLNKSRKVKNLTTGLIQITALSESEIAAGKDWLSGTFGVMPFYRVSDIPADAVWTRENKDKFRNISDDVEVYSLTYIRKGKEDISKFNMYRFYIDSATHLPERTEFYTKLFDEGEYTLKSFKVIEYLGDARMQIVLEDVVK